MKQKTRYYRCLLLISGARDRRISCHLPSFDVTLTILLAVFICCFFVEGARETSSPPVASEAFNILICSMLNTNLSVIIRYQISRQKGWRMGRQWSEKKKKVAGETFGSFHCRWSEFWARKVISHRCLHIALECEGFAVRVACLYINNFTASR